LLKIRTARESNKLEVFEIRFEDESCVLKPGVVRDHRVRGNASLRGANLRRFFTANRPTAPAASNIF
jgi:hypothetical protein